jgi:hypothetical protein
MRTVIPTVLALCVLACGGSTTPDTGPVSSSGSSSSGSGGTSSSSSSGGACTAGQEGDYCPWGTCVDGPKAHCSPDGHFICPPVPSYCGEPCGGSAKPLCLCGTPTCDSHRWVCSASCPTPFPCGTETCQGNMICTDTSAGMEFPDGGTPPDSLACRPIPSACQTTPTCDCIVSALKSTNSCYPSKCTEDAQGHVLVNCMGQ